MVETDAPQPEPGTRAAILRLLCTAPRTARELAEDLRVSATAVRKALGRLEGDGLVRYGRVTRGVGKPTHEYKLTPKGEQYISQAYLPLLLAVLQQLRARMDEAEMESLLRSAAGLLAPVSRAGTLRERMHAGADMLNDLGASATVSGDGRAPGIECACCAIAAVVREHPLGCKAVEALLSHVVGATVVERCDRSGRPLCRFELAAPQR